MATRTIQYATTANPFRSIEFTFKDCRVPYREPVIDTPIYGGSSLEFVAKTRKASRFTFTVKRNDRKFKSLSAKRKGYTT